jgi:cytochrome P450
MVRYIDRAASSVNDRSYEDREMELYGGYLNDLKADALRSGQSNCYVASYLKQRAESGHAVAPGLDLTEDGWLRDTMLAYTAGSLLEAGSDTSSIVLRVFILFMLSYPGVLVKAREEIDKVVGPNRMPDFEDESRLPYVAACIKECLRRRPPGPLVRIPYIM